jgi:hypothetical protein
MAKDRGKDKSFIVVLFENRDKDIVEGIELLREVWGNCSKQYIVRQLIRNEILKQSEKILEILDKEITDNE